MMERERTRIARDMHDEIGSKLTRISFLSELVKETPREAPESEQQITSIAQASRELLATLDELVWAVNPRNDSLEQLAVYFWHYANEYFKMTPVECRLEMAPELPQYLLSSEVRHNLFLAFVEALNNVLKHADASRVEIKMRYQTDIFEITIVDNGRGFDVSAGQHESDRQSNGLKNMRQRLADMNGKCVIASRPGEGTRVALILRLTKTEIVMEPHPENRK